MGLFIFILVVVTLIVICIIEIMCNNLDSTYTYITPIQVYPPSKRPISKLPIRCWSAVAIKGLGRNVRRML